MQILVKVCVSDEPPRTSIVSVIVALEETMLLGSAICSFAPAPVTAVILPSVIPTETILVILKLYVVNCCVPTLGSNL